MLLYKDLPKEYSGGLIGLNIFSGSIGMLIVSKLSVILSTYISYSAIYGLGVGITLLYLIIYLIYICKTTTKKNNELVP